MEIKDSQLFDVTVCYNKTA